MKNVINFLLSFLLVWIIIGYYGCCVLNGFFSVEFLVKQAEENNAALQICQSLKEEFDEEYVLTAVPSDVYMNAVTEEWMNETLKKSIGHYWNSNPTEDYKADYTALENAVNTYFEQYAKQTNYVKDEAYEKKLNETIAGAKQKIENKVDIYNFRTIRQSGILSKLYTLRNISHKLLMPLALCGIVCIMILVFMKKPCYWIGTSAFISGVLMIILGFMDFKSGITFSSMLLQSMVLNGIDEILRTFLFMGIIMILVGVVMVLFSVLIKEKDNFNAVNKTEEK